MFRKKTKRILTYITLILILVFISFHFYNTEKYDNLSLGTISSYIQPEYRVPVGGTLTIQYVVNVWNGREWYMPDLDTYQYNYKIIDRDTNRIIQYGAPWRLVHANWASISIEMNTEGTYNYALVETIDFLKEGRTINGTVKNFRVIVGSGITPVSTAISTDVVGVTPVPRGEIVVVSEPTPPPLQWDNTTEPPTTFNPYIPPPLPTPVPTPITTYTTTPTPTPTPTPIVETYTVVPTPVSMSSPLPTSTISTPVTTVVKSAPVVKETPEIPGFEVILVIIVLICLGRRHR